MTALATLILTGTLAAPQVAPQDWPSNMQVPVPSLDGPFPSTVPAAPQRYQQYPPEQAPVRPAYPQQQAYPSAETYPQVPTYPPTQAYPSGTGYPQRHQPGDPYAPPLYDRPHGEPILPQGYQPPQGYGYGPPVVATPAPVVVPAVPARPLIPVDQMVVPYKEGPRMLRGLPPGTHHITFIHPYTNCPVKVTFCLPCACARTDNDNGLFAKRLTFHLPGTFNDVVIKFFRDGTVKVKQNAVTL